MISIISIIDEKQVRREQDDDRKVKSDETKSQVALIWEPDGPDEAARKVRGAITSVASKLASLASDLCRPIRASKPDEATSLPCDEQTIFKFIFK